MEYMSNDEKQTKAEKEKRYRQLIETQDEYDDYVKCHKRDGEYATDPLVQATADKYDLCIHVSKYMFYNGSTTTQLLKASPVQLSGKNRMSGKDREQLYLKLENDHYTFEKEKNIKMNGDEWHDLITPISTSNGPDRFGDKHCRLALDNTKKDTSTFPTAKESLGGLDTVKQLKEKLRENLASQEQEPPVRIKSVSYQGLPYEPETSHGNKKPFISLRSAKLPVYLKNGSKKGKEHNRDKDDSSPNSPTEKGMDISNIDWKKLEGATSLKLQMEAAQISFGTIFKVCRKIKMLKYQYFHYFMILDKNEENFKIIQVNYNFFRGAFLENRVVNFKDGDNSLFDFSRGGVYFEGSNILNKTDREAIKLRIKYFKSLCIHFGSGPNRWNCESVLNFIKYGKKRLLNRSEADIFKKRYCITGPLVLWTVERLSTVLLNEALIFQILGNKISEVKSCNSRNHP